MDSWNALKRLENDKWARELASEQALMSDIGWIVLFVIRHDYTFQSVLSVTNDDTFSCSASILIFDFVVVQQIETFQSISSIFISFFVLQCKWIRLI